MERQLLLPSPLRSLREMVRSPVSSGQVENRDCFTLLPHLHQIISQSTASQGNSKIQTAFTKSGTYRMDWYRTSGSSLEGSQILHGENSAVSYSHTPSPPTKRKINVLFKSMLSNVTKRNQSLKWICLLFPEHFPVLYHYISKRIFIKDRFFVLTDKITLA